MSSPTSIAVAIINTSLETIELMQQIFLDEGFTVSGGIETRVTEFKRGKKDLRDFLQREQPDVVVWDIALPYAENWRFFRSQAEAGAFEGRGVVLTTTNGRALDEFVGPNPAIEVIGKPFDIADLIAAVRQAAGAV